MGSADFSVPIFMAVIKAFDVITLIAETNKPSGRKREIVELSITQIAKKENIPCWQPEKLKGNGEIIEKLKELNPDVIVVAAYGKILPKEILELPKHGCVNIHPSLLPEYRGASPIQTALLNGEIKTGISIILMDAGMDSGDIIAQEKAEIAADDNYQSLEEKLAERAAFLLVKSLPDYITEKAQLIVQDDTAATYCNKLTKENGKIDWEKSARQIINQVRAFSSWPCAYSAFAGNKIEILAVEPEPGEDRSDDYIFGQVFKLNEKICVQCGEGAITLREVKLEGKNKMAIKDFVNGHQNFLGAVLR